MLIHFTLVSQDYLLPFLEGEEVMAEVTGALIGSSESNNPASISVDPDEVNIKPLSGFSRFLIKKKNK